MAYNVQGLLPWRTSNLVNVPRPSGVTYFKTPRGRKEPWQQANVGRSSGFLLLGTFHKQILNIIPALSYNI